MAIELKSSYTSPIPSGSNIILGSGVVMESGIVPDADNTEYKSVLRREGDVNTRSIDDQKLYHRQLRNELDSVAIPTYLDIRYKTVSGKVLSLKESGFLHLDLIPQNLQPLHQEGRFFYDNDKKSFTMMTQFEDVWINVGEEIIAYVVNKTGATILNGAPVYIEGSQGIRPTIWLSRADDPNKSRVSGVTTMDIPNNEEGVITRFGMVRGLNTSSYSNGDEIFLDSTGGFTNVSPTGNDLVIRLGEINVSHLTQGEVFIQIEQLDHRLLYGRSSIGSHPASAISLVPYGDISATNLQMAIQELDDEKVPTYRTITAGDGIDGGGDMSANITLSHADTSDATGIDTSGSEVINALSLDGFGHVTALNTRSLSPSDIGAIADTLPVEITTNKGIANGYVPLNSSVLIDSIYLPSETDPVFTAWKDKVNNNTETVIRRMRSDGTRDARLYWDGYSLSIGNTGIVPFEFKKGYTSNNKWGVNVNQHDLNLTYLDDTTITRTNFITQNLNGVDRFVLSSRPDTGFSIYAFGDAAVHTLGNPSYHWDNAYIDNIHVGTGTVTQTKIANWDAAYGWGNPDGVYLPLSGGTMSGSIIPDILNTYDIGSIESKFAKGYFNSLYAYNGIIPYGPATTVGTIEHKFDLGWITTLYCTTLNVNGAPVSSSLISNWNTAYNNSHTHSNKTYLDLINQDLSTDADATFGSAVIDNSRLRTYTGSASLGAIYHASLTPSNTNYSLAWDVSTTYLNAPTTNLDFRIANALVGQFTVAGLALYVPLVRSGLINITAASGFTANNCKAEKSPDGLVVLRGGVNFSGNVSNGVTLATIDNALYRPQQDEFFATIPITSTNITSSPCVLKITTTGLIILRGTSSGSQLTGADYISFSGISFYAA